MATPERYVIDTNVLIRFLLFCGSVPGQAVTKAWRTGVLLRSNSTCQSLRGVLERPKFDRYLTRYERAIFSNGSSRTPCRERTARSWRAAA